MSFDLIMQALVWGYIICFAVICIFCLGVVYHYGKKLGLYVSDRFMEHIERTTPSILSEKYPEDDTQ